MMRTVSKYYLLVFFPFLSKNKFNNVVLISLIFLFIIILIYFKCCQLHGIDKCGTCRPSPIRL